MKKQILFLFIALLVSSCTSTNSIAPTPASEFETDTQDREVLEGSTEIQIPEQAFDLYGHIDGFRDIDTEIRFIIASSDFDKFLESTSCKLPLATDDVRALFQNQLDRLWWKPTNALKFKWCHVNKEHLSQNILIDITDTDKYIVYIMTQTK